MEEGAIETFLITAELLRSTEASIGGMQWSTWVSGLSSIGADLISALLTTMLASS
jgi:hypothetical protein